MNWIQIVKKIYGFFFQCVCVRIRKVCMYSCVGECLRFIFLVSVHCFYRGILICFKQKWKWKVTCFTINYFFPIRQYSNNYRDTVATRINNFETRARGNDTSFWFWLISPFGWTLNSLHDCCLLFLFRDYYCFINIFNSNYRRNNQDKWKQKCCKCVYRKEKKSVKQNKNEMNTRMLIFYSKNNKTKLYAST